MAIPILINRDAWAYQYQRGEERLSLLPDSCLWRSFNGQGGLVMWDRPLDVEREHIRLMYEARQRGFRRVCWLEECGDGVVGVYFRFQYQYLYSGRVLNVRRYREIWLMVMTDEWTITNQDPGVWGCPASVVWAWVRSCSQYDKAVGEWLSS